MYITHEFESLMQNAHQTFQLADFVVQHERPPARNNTGVMCGRDVSDTREQLMYVLYSLHNVSGRRLERFRVTLERDACRFDGLECRRYIVLDDDVLQCGSVMDGPKRGNE